MPGLCYSSHIETISYDAVVDRQLFTVAADRPCVRQTDDGGCVMLSATKMDVLECRDMDIMAACPLYASCSSIADDSGDCTDLSGVPGDGQRRHLLRRLNSPTEVLPRTASPSSQAELRYEVSGLFT